MVETCNTQLHLSTSMNLLQHLVTLAYLMQDDEYIESLLTINSEILEMTQRRLIVKIQCPPISEITINVHCYDIINIGKLCSSRIIGSEILSRCSFNGYLIKHISDVASNIYHFCFLLFYDTYSINIIILGQG